ncbi:MAG: hypothetical protein ACYSWU_17600 [Planctomycetota bacterium]|jgi:hypothetical protein
MFGEHGHCARRAFVPVLAVENPPTSALGIAEPELARDGELGAPDNADTIHLSRRLTAAPANLARKLTGGQDEVKMEV